MRVIEMALRRKRKRSGQHVGGSYKLPQIPRNTRGIDRAPLDNIKSLASMLKKLEGLVGRLEGKVGPPESEPPRAVQPPPSGRELEQLETLVLRLEGVAC